MNEPNKHIKSLKTSKNLNIKIQKINGYNWKRYNGINVKCRTKSTSLNNKQIKVKRICYMRCLKLNEFFINCKFIR